MLNFYWKTLTITVFIVFFTNNIKAQTAVFSSGMSINCWNSCSSPGPEGVSNAIDNNINTKFLDFSETNTGFYVNTNKSSIIDRMDLTTANDAPERDPIDYIIEGSNNGSTWNTITSGAIACISTRFHTRNYSFSNSTAYSWYRIRFNNVCNGAAANSMQVAEVQLYEGATLPVEWLYINVDRMENDDVVLEWATASETNCHSFEIERMVEGESDFNTIGEIPGHGNTQEVNYYRFIDESGFEKTGYFRLKQVDLDGTFGYSETKAVVSQPVEKRKVVFFPNPIDDHLFVKINIENKDVIYKIIGGQGREILNGWAHVSANGLLEIQGLKELSPSLYTIQILDGNEIIATQRILKQ